MKRLPPFDKYAHYYDSVQNVSEAINFFERAYQAQYGKKPTSLREDFCGTFALSCGWVQRRPGNRAYGIDLDPEPVAYGRRHYQSRLSAHEQKYLDIRLADVRDDGLPRADVIAAMNFSFYIIRERAELLKYFRRCREALNKRGVLILDAFGGTETTEPNCDETNFRKYTYYWDQTSFDPITHHSLFYIHYKRKGERKRERVFKYDWRMWTLPELRELLTEAGFAKNYVYWEGTDKRGHGNGIFRVKEKETNCAAWVAYLVAAKT